MIIKEADIRNFGKLQNKKYAFGSGINVIYGANEAGKTTLQQYIKSMMFGLEKKRGRAVRDEYQKYEPWEVPACFSGTMVFETGGQTFMLERNFYHKEKRSRLINLGDMEELSVDHGDLQMLLGNVSRKAYENTYCISQEKLLPDKDLGILLEDEKSNLLQIKDGEFQLSGVLQSLTEKRKAFEKKKKELEKERLQEFDRLKYAEQMLVKETEELEQKRIEKKEELRQQKTVLQGLREQKKEVRNTGKEIQEKKDETGQKSRMRWSPWILVGIAGLLLISMFGKQMALTAAVLHALQVICVALILAGLVITARGKKEEPMSSPEEERNGAAEGDAREEAYRKQYMYCEKLKAAEEVISQEIQEKEIRRANLQAQQEELMFESPEEAETGRNQKAAALAAETLQGLAREMWEDSDDCIHAGMSSILSRITGGRYDGLSLDEGRGLVVSDRLEQRTPEAYSQATMQQMYFAYRMAAGQMLAREESLPILLDEAFAGYDEERLRAVLKWLSEQDQQVFLFTCRHLEGEILRSEGISFHEICI